MRVAARLAAAARRVGSRNGCRDLLTSSRCEKTRSKSTLEGLQARRLDELDDESMDTHAHEDEPTWRRAHVERTARNGRIRQKGTGVVRWRRNGQRRNRD
mmetsp:Transcript_10194/g.62158  ORF Transcript_10194/g.62158 Transcript_10194/m.62158 type:complete len:100 (+) Transcript_10194:70-369(+)